MQLRYLKVFKRKILLLILVIALIVVSSVTKGKTSVVLSTITGIILIVTAIYYIVWIMRTPTKKESDEAL
ncbi:hypothetical protein [Segetibacter aerophilus]|uniref:Uncharacterized protein n=1 Tax=Segetibacter aerophilus TaxID=670293 RepID=A0A512BH71_9BACT|nr:hypothetical protein [Segetibacter aerophilus]GEO11313.1 hypothetical protein SAE01_38090 [Segetibacter aerophilus]